MKRWLPRLFLIAVVLLAPFASVAPVFAQATLLQAGPLTSGHVPMYSSQGQLQPVVQDSGGAGGGAPGFGLSELLLQSRSALNSYPSQGSGSGPYGSHFCMYDGPITNASGGHFICFDPNSTAGAALIATGTFGIATPQGLCFEVNGTQFCLPASPGSGLVTYSGTPVVGDITCWSAAGVIANCSAAQYGVAYFATSGALGSAVGTNGQLLVAQTSAAPAWKTASGDIASIAASGAVTIGGVNGVAYPAAPSVGTAPYVSGTNQITYGQVPATGGGTGLASPTAHGVLIAEGSSPFNIAGPSSIIGQCLLSQGLGADPIFANCASGTGSAGGANTQVQFNNASTLAGSPNLTWISPALTIGQNATATGQLLLASGTVNGASVTIQALAVTSAYNFNLPANAGTSGQPLISGGGGSNSMSFGVLSVGGGGTNCASPSGTCLDNITGFNSNGYVNRTGSGTYAITPNIVLANGGTSASLVADNGAIVYSNASSFALLAHTTTANQVLLSGNAAAPSWSTATYPVTTTANQLLYSSSNNTIAGLVTANNGVLVTSAGGVPSIGATLPAPVQGNITTVGTITSGTWNGSIIDLAHGGTNANLTASNGGIHYSTSSATAILAGTATANLPLLSGSNAAPAWAAISYPTSATSGGVVYASSTSAFAVSAALTVNQIMIGGGGGSPPSTFACATATTVVHGGTPPTCSQVSLTADVTGVLVVANGGTNLSSLTTNAIYRASSTSAFAASALTDNGTIVATTESIDVKTNAVVIEIPNAGTTGTTVNELAKLNGAPSTAVVAATSDTQALIGIVSGGAGTTGSAQIVVEGQTTCAFDGSTTAGDYFQASASAGGKCSDIGSTYPGSGQALGRVLTTNTGAGTYAVLVFPAEIRGGSGGGSGTVTSVNIAAGTGISISGTCNSTSAINCTLANTGVTSAVSGNGVFASASTGAVTFSSTAVMHAGGRLTLVTHTPVMTTTQSAKTTIFYDSYVTGFVPYYNGTTDLLDTITSNEMSLTLESSGTGVENSNSVFDIWFWHNSGSPVVCVATNGSGGGWASDTAGSNTTRGTGYSKLDNTTRAYITNGSALTHCYNGTTDYGSISANQATYLGTVMTDASTAGSVSFTLGGTASGGSAAYIGVWNYYNRVNASTMVVDSVAGYTYSTNTVRAANASNTNRVTLVSGVAEDAVNSKYSSVVQGSASAVGTIGLCVDSTSAYSGRVGGTGGVTSQYEGIIGYNDNAPLAGQHYFQACENSPSSASVTFNVTISGVTQTLAVNWRY